MQPLQQLIEFLESISDDFEPPLSSILDIEKYAKKILTHAVLYTLVEHGRIVGMIAFYCNDGTDAFCTMLAVSQNYRRCGVGGILLNSCISYVKSRGHRKISLEILNNNTTAIEFYKRMGFRIRKGDSNSVFAVLDLE